MKVSEVITQYKLPYAIYYAEKDGTIAKNIANARAIPKDKESLVMSKEALAFAVRKVKGKSLLVIGIAKTVGRPIGAKQKAKAIPDTSRADNLLKTLLKECGDVKDSAIRKGADMAEYILSVLKESGAILMSWGANSFQSLPDDKGLVFRVNGFRYKGWVKVEYNSASDAFDVTTDQKFSEVYIFELAEVIDGLVEKDPSWSDQEYQDKVKDGMNKAIKKTKIDNIMAKARESRINKTSMAKNKGAVVDYNTLLARQDRVLKAKKAGKVKKGKYYVATSTMGRSKPYDSREEAVRFMNLLIGIAFDDAGNIWVEEESENVSGTEKSKKAIMQMGGFRTATKKTPTVEVSYEVDLPDKIEVPIGMSDAVLTLTYYRDEGEGDFTYTGSIRILKDPATGMRDSGVDAIARIDNRYSEITLSLVGVNGGEIYHNEMKYEPSKKNAVVDTIRELARLTNFDNLNINKKVRLLNQEVVRSPEEIGSDTVNVGTIGGAKPWWSTGVRIGVGKINPLSPEHQVKEMRRYTPDTPIDPKKMMRKTHPSMSKDMRIVIRDMSTGGRFIDEYFYAEDKAINWLETHQGAYRAYHSSAKSHNSMGNNNYYFIGDWLNGVRVRTHPEQPLPDGWPT